MEKTTSFTPTFDNLAANPRYGKDGSLVYGAIWRHCQMYHGVCNASLNRITEYARQKSKVTAIKYIKYLIEDGYIIDTTPGTRYKPHTYKITGKIYLGIYEIEELEEAENVTISGKEITNTLDELGVQPVHGGVQPVHGGVHQVYPSTPEMHENEPTALVGVHGGVHGGVHPLYLKIDKIDKKQEIKNKNNGFSKIENNQTLQPRKEPVKEMSIPQIVSDIEEVTEHKIIPPPQHWNWLKIAFLNGFPDKIKARQYYKLSENKSNYGKWVSDYYRELEPNAHPDMRKLLESYYTDQEGS